MTERKRFLLALRRMGTGGIEQATRTLACALAKAGHDVHLLVLKGGMQQEMPAQVTVHCLDVDRISRRGWGLVMHAAERLVLSPLVKGSGFVWRSKRCSMAFARFVHALEQQYGHLDLILIRGQGAFESLGEFNDPRAWRVVESVTGRFPHNRRGRWLTRALYQDKQVLCVSQGVQQQLLEYLRCQNVTLTRSEVLYNAVPVEHIQQQALQPTTPSFEPPYLVHVGRLVPVKNQRRLLHAYQIAVEHGLKHDLVIIGDGSERAALEVLSEALGLSHKVHFLGSQSNPYPWVKQADAFVLSSNFEGLGLVLIEALALGTPCVACDVPGGIREVLRGDQHRLLAAPDEQALAEKMLEAVSHPMPVQEAWVAPFTEAIIIRQLLALTSLAMEAPHADPA